MNYNCYYQIRTGSHIHLETLSLEQAQDRLMDLSEESELIEVTRSSYTST